MMVGGCSKMGKFNGFVNQNQDASLDHAGYVDTISGWEIAGWLLGGHIDEKHPTFRVIFDGADTMIVFADLLREDVLTAGHKNGNVGFQFGVPERYRDGNSHEVGFFDNTGEALTLLDVKTKLTSNVFNFSTAELEAPQSLPLQEISRIIVFLDAVEESGLKGWAYNEAAPLIPTKLFLYIDGVNCGETLCDLPREDVRSSGHPSSLVGFSMPIPNLYYDDHVHHIEFRGVENTSVLLVGADRYPDHRPVFQFSPLQYVGRVDGLHDGAIRGWAILHDRLTDKKSGGLHVLVTLQNQPVAQIVANQFRADVAEAFDSNPNCGFVFVPPQDIITAKTLEFRFKIIPGAFELENSPYVASFPNLDSYRKIRDLATVTDSLFTQLWALRAQIKGLLPAEQHTLVNYDSWARLYHHRIAATPAPPLPAQYRDDPPLVSIICPSYRPRMKDFVAAVESILAQTYANWELIIVDDASKSPELTACIKAYAVRDSRIRPVFNQKNGGISIATNTALSIARGHFIAFFDHDDLMVSRAIEYMVEAALCTGAKMLYCDEDKIDDEGMYSEVNLKPDWNYRLLLAQNYVCHILFVERAHLEKAGPLRKECDGAQDHDLILRLAEITPVTQIHHVPEILYHWRKTPFSTAGSGKAKTYTVDAGIRAVSDHLAKKNLDGVVCSPRGITIYDIIWKLSLQPKVTIIIPYREHVGMTTECLNALRTITDYDNFEILLVDNWSTSDAALEFASMQAQMPATRVMRVEEKFNYSRINNLAVAASEGEFLLFLNNDVVVRDPSWLKQMMGEALADPAVGIVGNKLLYPNGLVQHAGIILGVGGVADHAHRGLTEDEPGYMARAICAQDLSAVTAACLLCRREAFERVGGFDEADLQVAFNDVDMCLKVGRAGYRIVWTPGSVAEHRESLSRGNDFKPEHQARFFHENMTMEERWQGLLGNDPHYNPHFSRQGGIFMDLRQ